MYGLVMQPLSSKEHSDSCQPSLESLQASGDDAESLNLTTDEFLEQEDLPPADHDGWTALASILSRSWWDRLWVRVLLSTRYF